MIKNPCLGSVIIVPVVVTHTIITTEHYQFLFSTIPLSITSFIYHNEIIVGNNIRNIDMVLAILSYMHHIIYFLLYSHQKQFINIIMLPGLIYIIERIVQPFGVDIVCNYLHAMVHFALIPCVYLNTMIIY